MGTFENLGGEYTLLFIQFSHGYGSISTAICAITDISFIIWCFEIGHPAPAEYMG
jgi:hypothetical protein